ncbi:MAG: MMPL family transporter [Acidimicrobiales bacterium]|nr:MMPL family transporter [Acidimicrobiales bacterium]GJM36665.1 MAG: membrane protein [Acidimicrobiales bacterium]
MFEVPGAESQQAFDLLEDRFPQRSGDTTDIVFAAADVRAPDVTQQVGALIAALALLDHVDSVSDPYATDSRTISQQATVGFATVQFDQRGTELPDEVIDDLKALVADANRDGLQVEAGGRAIQFSEIEGPGGRSERIGLAVAVIVLLVSFGSVVAMGLPLITALFSLGVALSILDVLANAMELSDFGPRLATLVGLGVGIDYALFIVSRFRAALHEGLAVGDAVGRAMDTSGRAVVFAGLTVVISLSGMLLMRVPIVQALAVGVGVAVVVVLAATLTLVPATLGLVAHRIDSWRVPGLHRDESAHRNSGWFRWSRMVQHRPWPFAIVGTLLLVALTIPVFSMRLGSADAGSDPISQTSRRAYDLLAEGFGPGFNGPFLVAAELPAGGDLTPLETTMDAIAAERGVAAVSPITVNAAGDTAIASVFPTTSPQDEATRELLDRLRSGVIPSIDSSGLVVHVGGVTAVFEDLGTTLADRLPVFIAAVIGLSFLLLMVVFRSIVIPIKAAVMNLLSIGAAYGVMVAIFQWGWGKDLIGLDATGPIQSFIPMLLFAVLFGLSMDYEVFLLSRIREEYVRSGDNATAVADGLAATARVITAAAAIMVAVFGSAALAEDRTTKLFGIGLATAIFFDATLVRSLLVPATMELMGKANWWYPSWLDRLTPQINIEGAVHQDPELSSVDPPEPELVS